MQQSGRAQHQSLQQQIATITVAPRPPFVAGLVGWAPSFAPCAAGPVFWMGYLCNIRFPATISNGVLLLSFVTIDVLLLLVLGVFFWFFGLSGLSIFIWASGFWRFALAVPFLPSCLGSPVFWRFALPATTVLSGFTYPPHLPPTNLIWAPAYGVRYKIGMVISIRQTQVPKNKKQSIFFPNSTGCNWLSTVKKLKQKLHLVAVFQILKMFQKKKQRHCEKTQKL